jgi:hypothetical protein
MKTTDFIKENKFIGDDAHAMHQDHEVQMARSDCYNAAKYAIELHKLLKNISEMEGLDGWVSEKITLANDYLRTVAEYLRHEQLEKQAQMPEMFTAESAESKFAQLLNDKSAVIEGSVTGIGSNLPQSDIETFGLQKGRPYKINPPQDFKPGDRKRAVQQLIPTQDKKDHIRSRLGKHVAPVLPESGVAEAQLDELSPKTLGSYVKKAASDVNTKSREAQQYKDMWAGDYPVRGAKKEVQKKQAAIDKRVSGIGRAADRLAKEDISEGFMDTVKQAFNDCVVGYPQGTSEGQFIQGWARAIRAETGRDIPLEKLAKLYDDYAERSEEIMQSHGTTNEGSAEDNLNELDKSTLGSYVKKAAADVNTKSRDAQQHKDMWAGDYPVRGAKKQARQNQADIDKRVGGISRAVDRLAAEDVAEGVTEAGAENNPVVNAITRRIIMQRTDLLSKYGLEKVSDAIDEVADFVGDVEEIGSSDVSGWVRHVEQMLGNMVDQSLAETTSAGGVATVPGVGGGPKVGSLFGGSYSPKTPFTGKKKAKESVIKR